MKRPRFELTRVHADGSREPPRVFPVSALPAGVEMDRRSFFGTGVTAASLALVLKAAPGCGDCQPPAYAHDTAAGTLATGAADTLYSSRSTPGGTGKIREAKAWALATGQLVKRFTDGPEPGVGLSGFQVLASGRMIAVADDGRVRLWEGLQAEPVHWLDVQPQSAREGIAASADGNTIAVAGDGKLAIWSLESRSRVTTLDDSGGDRFFFSPDGSRILVESTTFFSGTTTVRLRVWSIAGGQLEHTVDLRTGGERVALAPDNDTLARSRADLDGVTTSLWSLSRGEVTVFPRTERGHTGEEGLVFTPDGTRLLSVRTLSDASSDVVVRSASNLGVVGTLRHADLDEAARVDVSRDGRTAVVGSKFGRIGLFDLTTLRFQRLLQDPAIRRSCGRTVCTCIPVFI